MPNSRAETVSPPFINFRFEVILTLNSSISGISSPVCDAAFQECSGLDMTMTPKTLTEGGDHQRQVHLMGAVTNGRLTLRRGMTPNHQLWLWFAATAVPGQDHTATGQIRVLNADGSEAITFVLERCLPVKIGGPSLNAQNGQVAVEEMQLVYGHLRLKEQGTGGFDIGFSAGFNAGASAGVSAGASGSINASGGLSLSGGAGLSGQFSGGGGFNLG